jgi:hypothetical protein
MMPVCGKFSLVDILRWTLKSKLRLLCVNSEKGTFVMQTTKGCNEMQEGWKSQKHEMAFYLDGSLNIKHCKDN